MCISTQDPRQAHHGLLRVLCGRLLGFLGSLCLHEGLVGTNGYGRKWENCLPLRWNGVVFRFGGGVRIIETFMGGLGLLGVDGCGELGLVWIGGFGVVLGAVGVEI